MSRDLSLTVPPSPPLLTSPRDYGAFIVILDVLIGEGALKYVTVQDWAHVLLTSKQNHGSPFAGPHFTHLRVKLS